MFYEPLMTTGIVRVRVTARVRVRFRVRVRASVGHLRSSIGHMSSVDPNPSSSLPTPWLKPPIRVRLEVRILPYPTAGKPRHGPGLGLL